MLISLPVFLRAAWVEGYFNRNYSLQAKLRQTYIKLKKIAGNADLINNK